MNKKLHKNNILVKAGNWGVIYASEYLNGLNAETLEDKCDAVLKNGAKNVLINFAKTELINSIGISILISIIEKVQEAKANLSFCNLNEIHYDTFDMLGISNYIYIFPTETEALSRFIGPQ